MPFALPAAPLIPYKYIYILLIIHIYRQKYIGEMKGELYK